MSKSVFISAKMRGVPYYNFPAFDAARDRLKALGLEVFSPADMDRANGFEPWEYANGFDFVPGDEVDWSAVPQNFDLDAAIKRDNEAIEKADAVFVLHEGFADSAGATAEVALAMKLGKIVIFDTMTDAQILKAMGVDLFPQPPEAKITVTCSDPLPLSVGTCDDGPLPSETYHITPIGFLNTRGLAMWQETHGGLLTTASDPVPLAGETRYTDPATGGQKGEKLARFDLLPPDILWELAEHYGKGARKYADRNMEKGYPWSKSYTACQRHLNAFWNGEDIDAETGSLHLISAAWHCFTMAWFYRHKVGTDNRPDNGKTTVEKAKTIAEKAKTILEDFGNINTKGENK